MPKASVARKADRAMLQKQLTEHIDKATDDVKDTQGIFRDIRLLLAAHLNAKNPELKNALSEAINAMAALGEIRGDFARQNVDRIAHITCTGARNG